MPKTKDTSSSDHPITRFKKIRRTQSDFSLRPSAFLSDLCGYDFCSDFRVQRCDSLFSKALTFNFGIRSFLGPDDFDQR